jgi:hypothetical protein
VAETDAPPGLMSRTLFVDIAAEAVRRRRDQIRFLRTGEGDATLIHAFDETVGIAPVASFSGGGAMSGARAWLDRVIVVAGMNAVEGMLMTVISVEGSPEAWGERAGRATPVFPDDPDARIHDPERPAR